MILQGHRNVSMCFNLERKLPNETSTPERKTRSDPSERVWYGGKFGCGQAAFFKAASLGLVRTI